MNCRYPLLTLALEILNFAFVLLSRLTSRKGAEVLTLPGCWIYFARVQAILSRLQFSDHGVLLQAPSVIRFMERRPRLSSFDLEKIYFPMMPRCRSRVISVVHAVYPCPVAAAVALAVVEPAAVPPAALWVVPAAGAFALVALEGSGAAAALGVA
jgi:hypothetical protein